eukprot:scaffold197428_cov13-Tisochrysis_lutea.AAC.1
MNWDPELKIRCCTDWVWSFHTKFQIKYQVGRPLRVNPWFSNLILMQIPRDRDGQNYLPIKMIKFSDSNALDQVI